MSADPGPVPPSGGSAASAPRATYRLQFSGSFGFRDARAVVPYLAELGVSHLYASPIFAARPGSEHGYDIVDHGRLNPELGEPADFEALVADLRERDMGLVIDFVPNHMGIGPDNPWWSDVLEWGRSSPFAGYFDIDWSPLEPTLAGKVLLPVLADHYGAVLAAGELRLALDADAGALVVEYGEQRFPLSPSTYPALLRSAGEESRHGSASIEALATAFEKGARRSGQEEGLESVKALKRELGDLVQREPGLRSAIDAALEKASGRPEEPRSVERLHRVLERQAYRLAFWRVAAHEINYRRFFDINDLAGLRMEDPVLFETSHRLIRRLVADGSIQGIRLDHIDGLRDPEAYFRRLRGLGEEEGRSLYVLVEKILGPRERLRSDWAVHGTTGYEFMADVQGLFVDPRGERGLTRTYERFTGEGRPFEEVAVEAKRLTIDEKLASELNVLSNLFNRVAKQSRGTRDYTLTGLRRALADVVAHFPVYRTYVTTRGADADDRREIEHAVGRARRHSQQSDGSIYDFIRDVLTLDLLEKKGGHHRADVVDAALRFQQYTGPVTAKAIEDTAFYRYLRAASLNEVGGAPDRFGFSPTEFHEGNRSRLEHFPGSMVATATHDHKRGEDVRARLAVLSEAPKEWGRAVHRWARMNRRLQRRLDGRKAPGRTAEYLLYQTIVGVWPAGTDPEDRPAVEALRDRLDAYMLKAAREAKRRTSWTAPDPEYEAVLSEFVHGAVEPGGPFLRDAAEFAEGIGPAGVVGSLAQTVLKLTVPGVPDVYQGTEFWDLSLVDPDNRRPVDYEALRLSLADRPDGPRDWERLLRMWRDGRVKHQIIGKLLELRAARSRLFRRGGYLPLGTSGPHAERIVAFVRREEEELVVVVVPRLVRWLLQRSPKEGELPLPVGWEETVVRFPEGLRALRLREVWTGRAVELGERGELRVGELLSLLPVTVLSGTAG